MIEELVISMTGVCRELHLENFEECVKRIKDLKEAVKRCKKEKKLIVNLQNMAKDCPLHLMDPSRN